MTTTTLRQTTKNYVSRKHLYQHKRRQAKVKSKMDHYKVLGVHRSASKEEIKKAFRKLAMELHPDKHADSPKHVKDSATLKFKQLSEAYEILIDDHKRADYNIGRRSSNYNSSSRGGGYGYGNSCGYGYNYGYGYSGAGAADRGRSAGMALKFEVFLRFLATRAFLLNAAFAGVLVGGTYFIDAGRDTLWKMQNSGKSFEEAMESIEQAKALKDKR